MIIFSQLKLTRPDRVSAVARIAQEERAIQAELAELLKKIKRTCRPEFAERVETHLRSSGVLPPNDKARQ